MAFPQLVLSRSRPLRCAVFFGLYVVEGLPAGFALTAVANYLIYRGLGPLAVGVFAARVAFPWSIQFVWGPVIDRYQGSVMGRRKPWVLGAQFAAFLASLGVLRVHDPVAQLSTLTAAFLTHALFSSIQDASVDAMAISAIPESERGRINAFMRAGMIVGTGGGAFCISRLIHHAGFQYAAAAQSAVLLAMTALTVFIKEEAGDSLVPWGARDPARPRPYRDAQGLDGQNLGRIFAELARGFFAPRSFVLFAVTVLVYGSMSAAYRAYSYHLIHVLKWGDQRVSEYSGGYGLAIGLVTLAAAATVTDRVGPRRLMVAITGAIAAFLLAFNGLAPLWPRAHLAEAGLIAWQTFDPAFSVAAMPVLMSLCRPGVEGSQFTAYMALVNLTTIAGTLASGEAQLHLSAPTIGLACGLIVLSALVVAALAFRAERPPGPA